MPHTDVDSSHERDRRDYVTLDLLDRLEELIEEMDELGVSSRTEIEQRIADLEARLDDTGTTDEVEKKTLEERPDTKGR